MKGTKLGILLDHLRLLKAYSKSIRSFIKRYDQHSTTVVAQANQLALKTLTTEAVKPVDLKFCVDVAFLESAIGFGFFPDVQNHKEITDKQLREFLDSLCEETKKAVTLEQLDKLVQ